MPVKHLNIRRKYLPDVMYVNIYGQDFGQYGGEKKDKIGQKFLFYRASEQEKYIKKDK